MTDLRIKAMELAVAAYKDGNLVGQATEILNFLQGGSDAPAEAPSSNSASSTTPAAPRRKKASSAPSESTSPAPAQTEAASSTSTAAKEAEASPPASTGTSPASSIPSVDDVRGVLTRHQAACGGDMGPPREILTKYAPTGTLGSLKEQDRAKVISECEAAIKAKAK